MEQPGYLVEKLEQRRRTQDTRTTRIATHHIFPRLSRTMIAERRDSGFYSSPTSKPSKARPQEDKAHPPSARSRRTCSEIGMTAFLRSTTVPRVDLRDVFP
ncbi:uncharacterized protein LOC116844008 isoform X2 [Odontomachus brunneus]|uniref:uncharacterized protein LOC116844008 isoform X2 n=1 Tax=Odontomachus brunneus TaxID=486640 RepID=UPI0013F25B2C|nr:uncharacterized protein LOC116844008 isoform X2 [Odontomachus brunneus]